ncbi:hypothetical protein EMIT0P253_210013 [Pseudomonas sp. IT-P253]
MPRCGGASRSKAGGELTLGLMSGENQKRYADPISTVGASLLAMDLNDNACCLEKCAAFEFIVGTPPGASLLLHCSRSS